MVNAGYSNPQVTRLNLYHGQDISMYTHGFKLNIVLVRKSGWTREMIEERYRRVIKVYSQCKVKITKARLIEVDPPIVNNAMGEAQS